MRKQWNKKAKARQERLLDLLERLQSSVTSLIHATERTSAFETSSLYHLVQLIGFLGERSREQVPPVKLVVIVTDFALDVFREFGPRLKPLMEQDVALSAKLTKCFHFDVGKSMKATRKPSEVEHDLVIRLVRLVRLEVEELDRESLQTESKPRAIRPRPPAKSSRRSRSARARA